MPKLSSSVPAYRHHKASGQAVVTLSGKDHYLGAWRSRASRSEYERLIGEWLTRGRQPIEPAQAAGLTVSELAVAYLKWADVYYRKDGQPTRTVERISLAIRRLRVAYGRTAAAEFGPLALRAVQGGMITEKKSRRYINALIEAIRRMFKWGVSHELVPASISHALSTVPGLKKDRTGARELPPVRPVDDATIEATLPFLPAVVADMVRFQRLTGARPGELCILRPCDVDRSKETWLYTPHSHKTQHHGRSRVIIVGPQAQAILVPYLLRSADAVCFAPSESERKRRARQHASRKTPLSCGNRPGTNRVRRPVRKPGDQYERGSYAKAIRRAVVLANRQRTKAAAAAGEEPQLLQHWTPNRLRHQAATEIRRRFGLEAAQVVLGHASADVTQVYAERDLQKAVAVMKEVG